MKVAFEHLRLKQEGKFAQEMARTNLDTELENIVIGEDDFQREVEDGNKDVICDIFGNDEYVAEVQFLCE